MMKQTQKQQEKQKTTHPHQTPKTRPRLGPEMRHPLQALHDTVGNHGVLRRVQPKLRIGSPGDRYEREADRVADDVLRQKVPEGEVEAIDIQTSVSQQTGGYERNVSDSLVSRLSRARGSGRPLSAQVRAFVEPRLQFDFGEVRIHTDSEAAQMSQELGAQAFTHGQDIYFAVGQYDPQSTEGKRLLSHELTHVIQQETMGSNTSPVIQRDDEETMGPCSVILEYVVERPLSSDWPMWLQIVYAILSPLWVGVAALLQYLCYDLWNTFTAPFRSAWRSEEELPLTRDNFSIRTREELSGQ